MAIIDSLDIMSDQQTITGTSYSQRAKYVGAPCDWGQSGIQKFIQVTAYGNATLGTGISFAVLGYNKPDVSDAFVITQTEQFPNAEVTEGFTKFLPIPPVGKKYSYVCVKYVVTGGAEDSEAHEENLCPSEPVLNEREQQNDTYSAFITFTADTGLSYPFANMDKATR